jgi:uncharacterized protein (DUF58 family)
MSAPLFDADFLKRIERLSVTARRSFRGSGHGERRARTHGASTEFRDHRSYAPGDDLRHLDWNLYARHDRLHLKRFHDEQDVRVHLVLDASASMGAGEPSKFDAARRLVAALGWLSLTGQDTVVLQALGGEGPSPPPPLQGRASARRLLAWLEGLSPSGPVDLEEALIEAGRRARRPGIVFVVSDFLSGSAARGLERLGAAQHQVHALHVLSPEEREPRLEGDLRLVDSETGEDVVVSLSPRMLRIYRETLAGLEHDLQAAARRVGATVTPAVSDEAIEDLVFRRLRSQGLLA